MNAQVFKEIQTLKRQILPNEKVFLFGSQARGDAHEESDWDLLVLLDKAEVNFNEDYDRYAYPFSDISLKYGEYISVVFHTKKNWETRPSVLKCNVEQEGIEII
jgi:predicted nucleotidyltransferase